jgi:hypothetical protein
MKKLFQNKKVLLFTLILMASCFGILGVGGEIFAKDSSTPVGKCGGYAECSGLFTTDCHRDCSSWQTPHATCGALSSSCECECNDTCADNYCKSNSETLGVCTSSIAVHCITCPSSCCYDANSRLTGLGKSGQYACKEQLFCKSNNIQSCPNGCDMLTGRCKAASSTNCTSVGTQECYDTSQCKEYSAVTSGPRDCSSNLICIQKGSCIPKTTTGCDCNYGNYKDTDPPQCGNSVGCYDGQILQTRTKNPTAACGPNDCKYITQCFPNHSKCPPKETTPAAIVPVIPSSTGAGVSPVGNVSGPPPSSGGAVNFTNPLSTNSFEALVMGIINWILGIVVSLAILFLIIGGLMYIVSAGDEERIKKAKNIIMYAIIGLGVVILSWSIITELKDILGVK